MDYLPKYFSYLNYSINYEYLQKGYTGVTFPKHFCPQDYFSLTNLMYFFFVEWYENSKICYF